MELAFAFFAYAAQTSEDGQLHIIGGNFDAIGGTSLPANLPPFTLVVKFDVDPEDAGRDHNISIDLTRPVSGRVQLQAPFPIKTMVHPRHPRRKTSATIVVHLMLHVESEGEYLFHIMLDNREVKALPLYVEVQPPPTKE